LHHFPWEERSFRRVVHELGEEGRRLGTVPAILFASRLVSIWQKRADPICCVGKLLLKFFTRDLLDAIADSGDKRLQRWFPEAARVQEPRRLYRCEILSSS
jgi:hypothetical protein